jgi:hypothetical protein
VQFTAWSKDLRVTADGSGVVSHVGAALLRMLADRAGLTQALSQALTRRGWWPVRDRGRVLVDLAVMITDGGEAIADIDVLRHQEELFGSVASDSTLWRALDEIGAVQLRRIATARAKVRARMWQLFGGLPRARAAGRDIGAGIVVLDVDSTIVLAHSDKDGAAPTYKHTFGFHPILVTCDNTGELLAAHLRPGNAGANTAADHLLVLAEAFAQIPARYRRHLLVRGDSAAASHAAALADLVHHRASAGRVLNRLVDRPARAGRHRRAARLGVVTGDRRRRRGARRRPGRGADRAARIVRLAGRHAGHRPPGTPPPRRAAVAV